MIAAYYALHYGSDYLAWSIKSLYNHVDRIYILYTPIPSYGHNTHLKNPDNKDLMIQACYKFGDPSNKIKWIEGHWSNEVHHRNHAIDLARNDGIDCLIATDADEVWPEKTISEFIKFGYNSTSRVFRIRMLTFWRSFRWTCTDNMWPIRMTFMNRPSGDEGYGANSEERVLHFGYARTIENIEYKVSIHGHKGEWRPEWLEKYKSWPNSGHNDLHPVCQGVWNATPYDVKNLPELLIDHPYYNLEVI